MRLFVCRQLEDETEDARSVSERAAACWRMKWTARDDNAILEAANARTGDRWPADVSLPDRGSISGGQARRRWSKLMRPDARVEANGAGAESRVGGTASTSKRRRNTADMTERAAVVGVIIPPTPDGVRRTITDASSAPADVERAKRDLHRHQKKVQKIVSRAEQTQRMHLENGPDVSSLVVEFKDRDQFTWAEFYRELRSRFYEARGISTCGNINAEKHRECLLVATVAYQRAREP